MSLFKILILTSLITTSLSTTSILPSNHIAIQYIVQIEAFPSHQFLGVGTLITLNHILTSNSIYEGLELPQQIKLRFRSNLLGSGVFADPERIFQHGSENIAIILLPTRVNVQFEFSPRPRGSILGGRFCTINGFQGVSLAAVAGFTNVCGNNFCSDVLNTCGGFNGSPVICDGSAVGGFVTSCNNSRFEMESLEKYEEWIDGIVSSGLRINLSGVVVGFLIILNKIGF